MNTTRRRCGVSVILSPSTNARAYLLTYPLTYLLIYLLNANHA